jgi:NitT/TauT family transport system substrate-binding protein
MRRSVALALLLVAGGAGMAAEAAALKAGYSVWVGYGPLFLAREKGYYREEGAAVELINVEDPKERFTALAAKRLDCLVSTIDTMILYLKTGREYQYVLALDDSAGGDGIVARKEIRSVRDLKGKKVAFAEGSVSQFFLNVLLKEAGLRQADLESVNMKPGDAGAAFVAGRVDAAVTWEPHLTKGKATPFGHLLVDSSKTPGLITDVLICRTDVIQERSREVQGVVNGWNRAVAYWEKNPKESNAIMAKAVGGWLKEVKDFEETLTGIKFYNREANVRFFGTAASPGAIHQTVRNAIEIWEGFGKLQAKGVSPADLVSHQFVK